MTQPTMPHVSLSAAAPLDSDADALLIAAVRGEQGATLLAPAEVLAAVAELPLAELGITGAAEQVRRTAVVTPAGARVVVVVGLGRARTTASLRSAAGAAARQLSGLATVAVAIPTDGEAEAAALLEGLQLGGYRYERVRGAAFVPEAVPSFVVHAELPAAVLDRAAVVSRAVARTRDLVNEPANTMYPQSFVERAVAQLAELPVTTSVWDEAELLAGGFGAILSVGNGSSRGPRMLRASYAPAGATRHIALVGKGITFDTGGLSLKPAAAMVGMKDDMAGAATVLNVLHAVAELGLPIAVTAWMPMAENMPSGTATRPGDVVTARNGQTIEILNTDAEGRLVLGDAIAAASEEYPDAIIDVATLTGAQVVALGNRTVGLMGDDALVAEVRAAGDAADELLWPMPLTEELRPMLDSEIADIKNAKIGNSAGGMLLAAVFLRDFVGAAEDGSGPIPWAHLDVAGPAYNGVGAYGATPAGATGSSVRALISLLSADVPEIA